MDQKPVVDTDLSSSSVRFVCGSSFTLFLKDLWLFFSSFLSLVKKSQPAMSTIIWKEDWWLTIDVPVLSRQQRLIQLWGKHKHVDYNNDGITSAIRRGRKERGGRRVTRITVTEEDRWRPGQTVEEDMGISTESFFFFFSSESNRKTNKSRPAWWCHRERVGDRGVHRSHKDNSGNKRWTQEKIFSSFQTERTLVGMLHNLYLRKLYN